MMEPEQTKPATLSEDNIYLGISSCLLGQEVRYDGGHKRDRYITDVLSQYFEFIPFCPEVAIGLGIPRPTIRLENREQAIKAVIPDDGNRDVTTALADYGREIGRSISHLSGYIFKSRSPSCGMARVKVYNDKGVPGETSSGIYATSIMEGQPLLPVEEEGRLNDPGLRDNFIDRVFVYRRWQCLEAKGISAAGLIAFHTEHKFLIMAHHQQAMRELGRLVAGCHEDPQQTAAQYKQKMMQALKHQASRRNQTNVLQHIAGFLKRSIDETDRAELAAAIDAYRNNELPIIVPLTLIRHHLRKNPESYLSSQRFLEDRPAPLDTRRR